MPQRLLRWPSHVGSWRRFSTSIAQVVDALLAPPAIHPRRILISAAERARRRHQFFLQLQHDVFSCRPPPKYVHVAGTKGKGSVCELLRAALDAPGDRTVGCFTSPHLHSCRERIRVSGVPISNDALNRCGEHALQRIAAIDHLHVDEIASDDTEYHKRRLSTSTSSSATGWGAVFFDRLLAAAIIYYAECQCELVILEVGIGGLYDSTNFTTTEDVALSVVTSISRDHTALLGETLAEIARHKAGVMRPGRLTLTPASQSLEVLSTLRQCAHDISATLEIVPSHRPEPLSENRALATRAATMLDIASPIFDAANWPARFEVLQPHGRRVLVDSAHNGDSVARLLAYCRAHFSVKPTLVFGCGVEKEGLNDMLQVIVDNVEIVRSIFLVEANFGKELPPSKQPAPAEDLARKLRNSSNFDVIIPDPPSTHAALDAAFAQEPDSEVLVFGSLYVAAEAREWAVRVLALFDIVTLRHRWISIETAFPQTIGPGPCVSTCQSRSVLRRLMSRFVFPSSEKYAVLTTDETGSTPCVLAYCGTCKGAIFLVLVYGLCCT